MKSLLKTVIILSCFTLSCSSSLSSPNDLGLNGSGGGIIAFYSDRDGNPEIYVMNADGTMQTRLTEDPYFDVSPALSPDGSQIVFLTSRHDPEGAFPFLKYEIYVMNIDGSNLTRLTENEVGEDHPAWHPEGDKITFNADYDGDGFQEINVMNSDGTNLIRLTANSANDQWASWSPDGSQLVFCSDRDGNLELYNMNSDGSEQIRISNNSIMEVFPEWSPYGDRLAFMAAENGMTIWISNTDGSNRTQLSAEFCENPCWSPAGDQIVFQKWLNDKMEIFKINIDGTEITNLSNNEANDFWASWSVAED